MDSTGKLKSASAGSSSTSDLATRNAGGRPPKYDWDEFNREVVRRANTPDGLPDRNMLTRDMREWCIQHWGDEPSDSLLRERIAKIYPSA